MRRFEVGITIAVLLVLGIWTRPATAQAPDWEKVEIQTVEVAPGIAMLVGRGGNLGLSYGEDGVILVDDQYAPLTAKIKAAIQALTDKQVRFVLNTHWHDDHTGGNELLGQEGALIVAHDNVRSRMKVDHFIEVLDHTVQASPKVALPVVTFTQDVTFHLNGDEIHAFHVPPAHTDGDSVVHFRQANVVHMGDLYFNGLYPFIDVSAGGNIDGVISGVERCLEIIGPKTKVIPGHGPLATREDLVGYLEMLKDVRDAVAGLIAKGKSLEEIVAAKPSAEYDDPWGKVFLTPEQFVTSVHHSLASD